MLFSTTPNEMAIERMMTGVPHFPPKGHGLYVFNKFRYTAEDCDCRLCLHYDRKRKCKLPKCECMKERIEAGAVGYTEFMKYTFSTIQNQAFQKRLKEYIKESEEYPMLYKEKAHRNKFQNIVDRYSISNESMLSALYLLTADKSLWIKIRHIVGNRSIDFSAVRLGNVSPDAYTLFMTARDLYEGTKHITISDIADKDIVSREMFGIICNAMAIRRYGTDALTILEKDGDER